ncbi:MAG: prepilin-type cleavage/methylation domain-containing protein [Candidatus Latescibacteria bacterium]|jgi:Tfp pilus assembly protein PilE|nr:prepilin-type cleavage/methylation domain-containing protein [bacterium]MBD3425271.1 prepilin-type cleavage/methylation domain-containing protein [Candidatus Latescibacterota bacterium]
MKRKVRNGGWTLIELIIIIVILGIIASVTIPAYMDMTSSAEINGCQASQGTIRSAVAMHYAKNKGVLPDSLTTGMFVNDEIPECSTSGSITYTKTSDSTFTVQCSIPEHNTPAVNP